MATIARGSNPRGKNGKYREDPQTAANDLQVLDLWAQGKTQRQIAAIMGWANSSTVSRAIDRAYAATVAPGVDAARKRSLERIDHAYGRVRQILDEDHVMVSHGKVVTFDDGTPVLDPGPNLAAAGRIESLEARAAKLLGMDAPVKHSVDVIQRDAMHAEMEAMMAELEKNDATASDGDDGELVNAGGVDGPEDAG